VSASPRFQSVARPCAIDLAEPISAARGWRAFLTVDGEVATYCPGCAREEFGDA